MKIANPQVKGAITGAVMILFSLFLASQPNMQLSQMVIYVLFAAGIVWTVYDFYRTEDSSKTSFSNTFSQAFRYFIIVILMMVVFSFIYLKLHPEVIEDSAVQYREQLIKSKQKTPKEIEELLSSFKNRFSTFFISTAIFGYLIFGAIASAIIIGLFSIIRRK